MHGIAEVHVVSVPMRVPVPRRAAPRGGAAARPGRVGGVRARSWSTTTPRPRAGWPRRSRRRPAPGPTAVRDRVPVNATVPAVAAPDVPGVLARFPGCTTAKVKVAQAGQVLADDVARVAAVREVLGPARPGAGRRERRLDARARPAPRWTRSRRTAWSTPSSRAPTLEDLAALRGGGVLIAADESVRKAEDPLRVARLGAADVLVLKVAPLGGVRPALAVAGRVRAARGRLEQRPRHVRRHRRGRRAGGRAARPAVRLRARDDLADGRRRRARVAGRARRLRSRSGRSSPTRRCSPRSPRRRTGRPGGTPGSSGARPAAAETGGVNPSTALARVLVDELVRGGVREAVLSPGSRSAPLAFALHAADAAGRLRLHVRIDERSAAFLALGLAKASGRAGAGRDDLGHRDRQPAPGRAGGLARRRAAAAAHGRPAAGAARHRRQPDRRPGAPVRRRGAAVRRGRRARGPAGPGRVLAGRWPAGRWPRRAATPARAPGPVQLNLGLREPLVPDGDDTWVRAARRAAAAAGPWTARVPARRAAARPTTCRRAPSSCSATAPAGPAQAALRLAAARGWPVVAEPSSGASRPALAGRRARARPAGLLDGAPARTGCSSSGRPTLSRVLGRLVATADADVVGAHGRGRTRRGGPPACCPRCRCAAGGRVDPAWLPAWQAAAEQAQAAVDRVLAAEPGLSEPVVAREVVADAAGDLLLVGSSKPVRDLFLAGVRAGPAGAGQPGRGRHRRHRVDGGRAPPGSQRAGRPRRTPCSAT